jgi:hypothetical protein
MAKITLKLYEFYSLEAELNGVIDQQTGQKVSNGLLLERLKVTTKYWLQELAKKAAAEKEACEAIRQDLIKKYGEEDEQGNIAIQQFINVVKDTDGKPVSGDINPKFIEFQTEWNNFLNEDKDLDFRDFKLSEFEETKSDSALTTFFKLVTAED